MKNSAVFFGLILAVMVLATVFFSSGKEAGPTTYSFVMHDGKNIIYSMLDLHSGNVNDLASTMQPRDIGQSFSVCGTLTSYICFVTGSVNFALPRQLQGRRTWTFGGDTYRISNELVMEEESILIVESFDSLIADGSNSPPERTRKAIFSYSTSQGLQSLIGVSDPDGINAFSVEYVFTNGGLNLQRLEQDVPELHILDEELVKTFSDPALNGREFIELWHSTLRERRE